MRISDCAELTGTTVRTIRYYHQIGLLPVPDGPGRRDYELSHVARILRIRWLADAGLPLDAIASVLASGEASTLNEFRATADSIEARIAELTEQRERIGALMTMAEQGREFTLLPESFGAFYDRITKRLDDPDAIEALRRERRIGEMFAQRGLLPAPAALDPIMSQLTESDEDRVVEFYTRYVRIPRLPADEADALVTELRQLIADWSAANTELTAATLALMPRWSTSGPGRRILKGFMTLVANDHRQARLLRGIVDDLLTTEGSTP